MIYAARLSLVMLMVALGPIIGSVNAFCADDDIVFSPKNFVDSSSLVGISGTLTGDGLGYKNNTRSIMCIKEKGECMIATIEQIGDKQVGRLGGPYSIPITRWTELEVVAVEEPGSVSCIRTTIFIERRDQTALWVQEPTNTALPQCETADTQVRHWKIEDSIAWKRLNGKMQ
jgi:hypothetical protein